MTSSRLGVSQRIHLLTDKTKQTTRVKKEMREQTGYISRAAGGRAAFMDELLPVFICVIWSLAAERERERERDWQTDAVNLYDVCAAVRTRGNALSLSAHTHTQFSQKCCGVLMVSEICCETHADGAEELWVCVSHPEHSFMLSDDSFLQASLPKLSHSLHCQHESHSIYCKI